MDQPLRVCRQTGKRIGYWFYSFFLLVAHIVGKQGGNTFLDRDVTFVLGECIEAGLPEGIDKAIRKFKTHEKATVHMKVNL